MLALASQLDSHHPDADYVSGFAKRIATEVLRSDTGIVVVIQSYASSVGSSNVATK